MTAYVYMFTKYLLNIIKAALSLISTDFCSSKITKPFPEGLMYSPFSLPFSLPGMSSLPAPLPSELLLILSDYL